VLPVGGTNQQGYKKSGGTMYDGDLLNMKDALDMQILNPGSLKTYVPNMNTAAERKNVATGGARRGSHQCNCEGGGVKASKYSKKCGYCGGFLGALLRTAIPVIGSLLGNGKSPEPRCLCPAGGSPDPKAPNKCRYCGGFLGALLSKIPIIGSLFGRGKGNSKAQSNHECVCPSGGAKDPKSPKRCKYCGGFLPLLAAAIPAIAGLFGRGGNQPSAKTVGGRKTTPKSMYGYGLTGGRSVGGRAVGGRAVGGDIYTDGASAPSPWITFVRDWARDHGVSYRDALRNPEVKKAYSSTNFRVY